MPNWIENEFADELPEIEVGDIVHFLVVDGFHYCVKAVVTALYDDYLEAEVDAIFDWEGDEPDGPIGKGESRISEMAGETIEKDYGLVHAVYEP